MAKKRPKTDFDNALRGMQTILSTPSQTTQVKARDVKNFLKATDFTLKEVTDEANRRRRKGKK